MIYVYLLTGQSNAEAALGTGALPDIPEVRYWPRIMPAITPTELENLGTISGKHSVDYPLSVTLLASGRDKIAIVKVCQGGQLIREWLDDGEGEMWPEVESAWGTALPLIQAHWPDESHRTRIIWLQGESNCLTELAASVYAEQLPIVMGQLRALVADATAPTYIVQIPDLLVDTATDVVQAAIDGYAASDPHSRLIETRDIDASHYDSPHWESSGLDIIAARIAAEELDMGTLSAHLRNALLDHALGVATYTRAATVYLAAFVVGVEVTGNAYERKAVTNNATNFPAAAGRAKSLGVEQQFVTATGGSWGSVDELRIYDAATGGNELARDDITPVAVGDGDTLTIAAGDIDITAAAGAISDELAEALLDHAFGGGDYTPETDVEFAYFDGDPQDAGVEITGTGYARDVLTNDGTTWAAASAGASRNLIDVGLGTAGAADWDTADYFALFDAAGTGLMISAALPVARAVADGETETIQAGRVRVVFS